MIQFLFVYGTLRAASGHPMHEVLAAHAPHEGDGWVAGTLYDLGSFPGAVPGTDRRVRGEVYRLRGQALIEPLDRYEGCGPNDEEPHLFRRDPVDVHLDDGTTINAWIYWYVGGLTDAAVIPGGDYSGHSSASEASGERQHGPRRHGA